MTRCAIKVCRNYKGRLKTSNEVSYHRMPKDPVIKNCWVDIIRRSREEDLWKPAKTTVICSDHFRDKDMYFVNNKKRRRLKKEAVPNKALFISSCKSGESENSDEIKIKRQRGLPSKASTSAEAQSVEDENSTTTPTQTMDITSKKSRASVEKSTAFSKDIQPLTLALQNCDDVEDYSDLDSIFDTPKKAKLREKLRKKTKIYKKHMLKIQSLRRKNLRLQKKIATFKQILQTLKTERYIDNDIHDVLCSNVFAADLYALMKKKVQGKSKMPILRYAPEFRKFCLTLHFLSPNAYSYVRRKFDTCLPHPKTIAKWYSIIDGSPGLTEEAFKILEAKKQLSQKILTCALIADEMFIRRQKCFNPKTHQDEGLVDFGFGPTEENNITASEAYVFMLVCLNEPWKLPIAYFLIHSMTGSQKANMIRTILLKCHEVGVDVVSLTFDGHQSNLSAMKELGCKIDDPRQLTTTFKHPCSNDKVAVFLDFCHMIKLVRNNFQRNESFLYNDKLIKWEYVKKLAELQEDVGLHLANRLTKKHIDFRNSIMNVKLATQLLSRSVSNAIEFCRHELNLSGFAGSQATEKFIMKMNNAFDIFNSRNFQAYGYKRPLNPNNKDEVFEALEEVKKLILGLCLKASRKRTYKELENKKKLTVKTFTPVLSTSSFTGFLGILICIESLKFLYASLVETKDDLKYLTTYRLSQDHIEIFFGSVRMHGGYNDNPNARQFKGIYRKLLFHMELKAAASGNCVPLENISVLMCSSALKCINETTSLLRKDDEDESENVDENIPVNETGESISRLLEQYQLAEYTKQIVGYIAGCVVRCLSRQIKCNACIESLCANGKPTIYHNFVSARDKGGLIYCSQDVFSICMTTETVIRKFIKQNRMMTSSNYTKMFSSVMKHFISSNSTYFEVQTEHICGHLHQVNLIRLVADKYLTIRCHHISKLGNLNSNVTSKRKLFKKQIQREGH